MLNNITKTKLLNGSAAFEEMGHWVTAGSMSIKTKKEKVKENI